MKKYILFIITAFVFSFFYEVNAQEGSVVNNPINLGSYNKTFSISRKIDVTKYPQGDIFFQVSLEMPMEVTIDNWGSTIPSTNIELLDLYELQFDDSILSNGSYFIKSSPNKNLAYLNRVLPTGRTVFKITNPCKHTGELVVNIKSTIATENNNIEVKFESSEGRTIPIDAGVYDSDFIYTDARDTNKSGTYTTGYQYGADFSAARDVYYKLTIEKPMHIRIHHRGSLIEYGTWIHVLKYPQSGDAEIYYENGEPFLEEVNTYVHMGSDKKIYNAYEPKSQASKAEISLNLSAGTYYIYSEGTEHWGNVGRFGPEGVIITTIEGTIIDGSTENNPINIGAKQSDFNFTDRINKDWFSAEKIVDNTPYKYVYYRLELLKKMDISIEFETCPSNNIFQTLLLKSLNDSINDDYTRSFDNRDPENGFKYTIKALESGVYFLKVLLEGDHEDIITKINGVKYIPLGDSYSSPIDLGVKNESFTFLDKQNSKDFSNSFTDNANDIFYKFELSERMNLLITNSGSEVKKTNITILDSDKKKINSFTQDWSNNMVNPLIITLDKGVYYTIVEGVVENGNITTTIEGLVEIVIEDSEPIKLSTSRNYVYTIVPIIESPSYTNLSRSKAIRTVNYYDGLGRPEQTVQIGITTNKKNLISYQEYDAHGRNDKIWLPVVDSRSEGFDYNVLQGKGHTNYGESAPFSKPVYEASPLNRVLEQYGPGQNWYNNGKSVKTGYLTNKAKSTLSLAVADSLVCALIQHSGTLTFSYTKNYAAGELYVTRIKDENDNTSYEFKDKLGQVVLTRQINGSQLLDTYYVYDDFGNLTAVFPPMASDLIYNDKSQLESGSNMRWRYAYMYSYDHRNRCIQKKLPGADWIYYVYDKADQLIFSQDGEQRTRKTGTKSEWTFNKYDAFGRLIISGIYKTDISHANLQTKYKDVVFKEEAGAGSYGYTWNVLKTTDLENANSDVLLVNYYDDVNNLLNLGTHTNYKELLAYNTESGYGVQHTNSKGLLVATRVKNIDSNGKSENTRKGEIATAMYYDNRGRVIQTKSTNHLGGVDKEYIAYDFVGNPTQRKTVHSATGKTTQTEIYKYTYDHAGRLLTTTHQLNSGTVTTLAKNEYDELGRLKSNQKHTHANLKTNYSYNIRSWTKSISSPLFNQTLYYNEVYGGSKAQYNGNISAMSWKVSGDASLRGYAFSYDNLSRLTAANYLINGAANTNYKMQNVSYDKHGNMTKMQLYGKRSDGEGKLVDDLTMNYNGNQLKNIIDAVKIATPNESEDFRNNNTKVDIEYVYNSNGAMTKDLNKGISSITYNSLNLPQSIAIDGKGSIEYLYSASGQKLQTVHKTVVETRNSPVNSVVAYNAVNNDPKKTDYVGNRIYEDGVLKRILVDGGYIDAETNEYHFYITDHLGNNRVVAKADGTAIQKTHYYPFGAAFAEDTKDKTDQPYKYNGKELDKMHGLNMYDYSARHYDAAIGRFTTIDPLAEMYYSWSPYHYAANNPIRITDPTGMLWNDSTSAQYARDLSAAMSNRKSDLYKKAEESLAKAKKEGRADSWVGSDEYNDLLGQHNSMSSAITELGEMGRDLTQRFAYNMVDGNNSETMIINGIITMNIGYQGNLSLGAHETSHGYDVFRGGMPTTSEGLYQTEKKAYGRQFSFGGKASMPKSDWQKIKTFNDVNNLYIGGIKDKGIYMYARQAHYLGSLRSTIWDNARFKTLMRTFINGR